jgi:hypothetical protein
LAASTLSWSGKLSLARPEPIHFPSIFFSYWQLRKNHAV